MLLKSWIKCAPYQLMGLFRPLRRRVFLSFTIVQSVSQSVPLIFQSVSPYWGNSLCKWVTTCDVTSQGFPSHWCHKGFPSWVITCEWSQRASPIIEVHWGSFQWGHSCSQTLRNTPGHCATHLDIAQYCYLFWRDQSWHWTLRNTPRQYFQNSSHSS